MTLFRSTAALVLALGATFATPALAQKKYDTGASAGSVKPFLSVDRLPPSVAICESRMARCGPRSIHRR
jgi:hypothetical protein